ncbi:MAG TPA: RidA family protein [Gemmatimonadales bacterium]|nr:RidA family protein [Gemmatimonadales bacterium]
MKPSIQSLLLALSLGTTGMARAQDSTRYISPPTLPPTKGYSQVVEVPAGARLVYISGQVPLDKEGKVVGVGDFRRQVEQVFTNLETALNEAGATFADVVKLNFYVLDMTKLQDLREVRDQHVNQAASPASTLVEVRKLFRDEVLIEVEAVAAIVNRGP